MVDEGLKDVGGGFNREYNMRLKLSLSFKASDLSLFLSYPLTVWHVPKSF
jgi:hypothetical protein